LKIIITLAAIPPHQGRVSRDAKRRATGGEDGEKICAVPLPPHPSRSKLRDTLPWRGGTAHLVTAFVIALCMQPPASAQDAEPTLLPQSLNLPVLEGSIIPEDCMYPGSITDTTRYELACVTMPRFISGDVGAAYIGELGTRGWRQGAYISGGMTAVRTDEGNCEHVLNIFPSDFPPGTENSDVVVIWFALDRTPRCARQSGSQ
jgi:hypothetical protein